jgi:hypothetical protein
MTAVSTPWRRLHVVAGDPSYYFKGTLQSSIGAIRLEIVVGIHRKSLHGVMDAHMGDCFDNYVDIKAH